MGGVLVVKYVFEGKHYNGSNLPPIRFIKSIKERRIKCMNIHNALIKSF